jgi:predicted CoA-binding protein
MITKANIDRFFESKTLAIAGVSRNPKKFPNAVLAELAKKGFTVYPINPNTDEVAGVKCYRDVASLPAGVESLAIITKKDKTESLVDAAIARGIKNVWIQQMSETPAAIDKATKAGINLIYKKCLFMFSEPVSGMHKFHRSIKKLFGSLPQ